MGESANVSVDVDVLIIGGGPQGLWILDAMIDAGYTAMLVEREMLGAGQSSHAEWFLHQGTANYKSFPHFYDSLAPSAKKWDDRLALLRCDDCGATVPSLVAFDDELEHVRWRNPGKATSPLPKSVAVPRPSWMSDVWGTSVYKTEEKSIRQNPYFEAINELRNLNLIHFDVQPQMTSEDDVVQSVRFHLDDRVVDVTSRFVVVSAGKDNESLLTGTFHIDPPQNVRRFQTSKQAALLVLRSTDSDVIPHANLIIPELDNLMCVYRKTPVASYWVAGIGPLWGRVSNELTEPTFEGLLTVNDVRLGMRRLWENLLSAAPVIGQQCERLSYRVYEGGHLIEPTRLKQNRQDVVSIKNVESFDALRNLVAVWPQRLTLAPHWADKVLEKAKDYLGEPSESHAGLKLDGLARKLPVAGTVWEQSNGFCGWEEFARIYKLEMRSG